MKELNRDLLVLLKTEFMTDEELEREVTCLNEILHFAESPLHFCVAHELVNRNGITRKHNSILKAVRKNRLKAFWFLINKN